jgi:hypothetical protein
MSDATSPLPRGLAARLPERLRPLSGELLGDGRRRLIETTLLLIAGLLLAIATVNDVVLQSHVNHRLVADLRTWRAYTRHGYRNLSVEQDLYGHTTREIVCGNTAPGAPKERVQLCLVISGPVLHGRRVVGGGWYLPAKSEDLHQLRYGCFGSATTLGLCR